MIFPRASLGKSNVTAAVLREGAAPEKSSPQSCPERVPASWEPAGAGEEAAAALGNQLGSGRALGALLALLHLACPRLRLPLVNCHRAVVMSLPKLAQIMFWESLFKSVFRRCVSLIFALESRQ